MYAAFPRADYYEGSVLRSEHHRAWRLAWYRNQASESEFPCSLNRPVAR